MRARSDVHARHRAAEHPPGRLRDGSARELRVEVAGVHDPEGVVLSLRHRPGEVARVEAVRDGDDGRGHLGELPDEARSLLRVHDDRGRRGEELPHAAELAAAVEPARVHLHLVERPRIAEVGDPRNAEPRGDAGGDEARLERRHRRVHQIGGFPLNSGLGALFPPAEEVVLAAQPAVHAAPDRPGRFRRVALDPTDDGVRGHLGRKRGIRGRPAARLHPRPGHDDRFVAVLWQVAHELYGALNPGAADRREVVGEEENPFHSEGSGTRPNSRTTRAGTPTATA